MKVMIIDDVQANLTMLGRLLVSKGYDVVLENSPVQALEVLEKDSSFGVIITDYMMPELKGFEFFQQFRNLPGNREQRVAALPPVVLITGWSQEFSEAEALNMGFYAVLNKPFPNNTMLELLATIEKQDSMSKKNILFIQYDCLSVLTLRELINRMKFNAVFVDTMTEAINYCSNGIHIDAIYGHIDEKNLAQLPSFLDGLKQNLADAKINSTHYQPPQLIFSTPDTTVAEQLQNDNLGTIIAEPLDIKAVAGALLNMDESEPQQKVVVINNSTIDVAKFVKRWGYDVLDEHSPQNLLALLKSEMGRDVCLIICDMTNAEFSNLQIYQECLTFQLNDPIMGNRDLPFIILCDSEERAILANSGILQQVKLIPKPLNMQYLRQQVALAMDNPDGYEVPEPAAPVVITSGTPV